MNYLVYDIESTGLDTQRSEILELCIIDYKSEEVLLHEYVYPDYESINNKCIGSRCRGVFWNYNEVCHYYRNPEEEC